MDEFMQVAEQLGRVGDQFRLEKQTKNPGIRDEYILFTPRPIQKQNGKHCPSVTLKYAPPIAGCIQPLEAVADLAKKMTEKYIQRYMQLIQRWNDEFGNEGVVHNPYVSFRIVKQCSPLTYGAIKHEFMRQRQLLEVLAEAGVSVKMRKDCSIRIQITQH
jgi:hypothetical protein